MRKSLLVFAPLALVGMLHVACSAKERAEFAPETAPTADGGGFANFEPVDASTDARGCSESNAAIERVPVVIEFAVDDSGSMDSGGKWDAARDALLAAFDDMKNTGDPAMFVGLLRWSSNVGEEVDPGALVDPKHYDDLLDAIDTPKACPPCNGGGTVMAKGLNAAYKAVETFKPPAGFVQDKMNRAVVVVSDGTPTDKATCEPLVESKYTAPPPDGPILTFSVGIGPFPTTSTGTYDPAFMSRIAQRGGTAPIDCSPDSAVAAGLCHFQINTNDSDYTAMKQALIDAINKIRAASATCEFAFTKGENASLSDVKVEITDADGNKTEVPKDPDNGWSFNDPDNPTSIVLKGDACAASNATVSGRVDVVLGCQGAK